MNDNIEIFDNDEVDAWFEELPDARKRVMRHRIEMAIAGLDDQEVIEQIGGAIIHDMYLADLMGELEDEGLIASGGVADNGQIRYQLTEEGKVATESS